VSDEANDLLQAVEDELRRRRFGEVVRLEVGSGMDASLRNRLIEWLNVEEVQVYDVEGLLDLGDLWQIASIKDRPDLRWHNWNPVTQQGLVTAPGDGEAQPDLFAMMRAGDVLVHYPYQSFATSVERFVKQAVDDPNVLAIKMTVYRTSDDSALVPSLIEASEKGKQAVCLVELKARRLLPGSDDVELDEELVAEGWAREIVHSVQAARRAAGLDISDRIALTLDGDLQLLGAAREHQEYIAGETLAVEVRYAPLAVEPVLIDGLELRIEVQKV
jgi:hypothetical protein